MNSDYEGGRLVWISYELSSISWAESWAKTLKTKLSYGSEFHVLVVFVKEDFGLYFSGESSFIAL